jgi:hypothetical protein
MIRARGIRPTTPENIRHEDSQRRCRAGRGTAGGGLLRFRNQRCPGSWPDQPGEWQRRTAATVAGVGSFRRNSGWRAACSPTRWISTSAAAPTARSTFPATIAGIPEPREPQQARRLLDQLADDGALLGAINPATITPASVIVLEVAVDNATKATVGVRRPLVFGTDYEARVQRTFDSGFNPATAIRRYARDRPAEAADPEHGRHQRWLPRDPHERPARHRGQCRHAGCGLSAHQGRAADLQQH